MFHFDPSRRIQEYAVPDQFDGVNPSITDSSTFAFKTPETMEELFDHEIAGCFLYSRHWNPTNKNLSQALAALEDTESAQVTASGMGAISCALLQLCQQGDEIVSSRTIYGGTYALLKNFFPRIGINTRFVDITSLDAVRSAMTERTKVVYCESMANPLLHVSDIAALRSLADEFGAQLVVDNTFSPLIISPARLGAHVVVHSMTKFINGHSDCVAGAICGDDAFVHSLTDINEGAGMLLGPVLDSFRSASILKNLHTLHIRMEKHSANAMRIAELLEGLGLSVFYPGLKSHPQHQLMTDQMNADFGYGGILTFDAGDHLTANRLMLAFQQRKVGYLAVSLGYFKTLFSSPGSSTSSEIPKEEQAAMGLSDGMIRMSIGLDHHIEETFEVMQQCLSEVGLPC